MERVVKVSEEKTKTKTPEDLSEEEASEKEEAQEERKDLQEEVDEKDAMELLKEENQKLKDELEKFQNKYYKAHADLENVRKRLERNHRLEQKYKIQNFALDILPAIDNLERALKQESEDEALKEGVEMIYQQILTALEQEGVKAIEALDQEFDPQYHQAMMTEKKEGVKPNVVIEEFQKGYMLKDRILRASLVKVSE